MLDVLIVSLLLPDSVSVPSGCEVPIVPVPLITAESKLLPVALVNDKLKLFAAKLSILLLKVMLPAEEIRAILLAPIITA